jgi:hypothetical protein
LGTPPEPGGETFSSPIKKQVTEEEFTLKTIPL